MSVRDTLFIDGMMYCHESKKQGKHVVLVRDNIFIDGMYTVTSLRNRVNM